MAYRARPCCMRSIKIVRTVHIGLDLQIADGVIGVSLHGEWRPERGGNGRLAPGGYQVRGRCRLLGDLVALRRHAEQRTLGADEDSSTGDCRRCLARTFEGILC